MSDNPTALAMDCCSRVVCALILGVQFVLAGAPASPKLAPEVVIVEHPEATRAFAADEATVAKMFRHGLLVMTRQTNETAAWQSLLPINTPVGIKVVSSPGALVGTRSATVAAAVQSLLASGWAATNVLIWDQHLEDLRRAGYVDFTRRFGVEVVGAQEAGYDASVRYESSLLGRPISGVEGKEPSNAALRYSSMTKLVTQRVSRHINIAPLINHPSSVVHGCLQSLSLEAADNVARFESSPVHQQDALPHLYRLATRTGFIPAKTFAAQLALAQPQLPLLLARPVTTNDFFFYRDPSPIPALDAIRSAHAAATHVLNTETHDLIVFDNAKKTSWKQTFLPDGRASSELPESRVCLNVTDGLVAQFLGSGKPLLTYAAMLNQLRFSTDPVALDLLAIQELERLRGAAREPTGRVSLAPYQNAAKLGLGSMLPPKIRHEKLR